MNFELIKPLLIKNKSKVVLLIMDGLGGLPGKEGKTELESAHTPNMDNYAKKGECGLHVPISYGITPGSGPSHLAVFGYNPVKYKVGRGALSALGIGFEPGLNDVMARGNFCTVNSEGIIEDRRAGRISTEKNEELCEKLREIKIEGAEIILKTVKEHRFLLVIRAPGLGDKVNDTDPSMMGKKPEEAKGEGIESNKAASIINQFVQKAKEALKDEKKANMILLRGFSKLPVWEKFEEVTGMRGAAIAGYPMYKGVSRLIGNEVLETGETIESEFDTLKEEWQNYDFFYLHVKKTDSYGEDGNFEKKVELIEKTDELLSRISVLKPDVLIITGDHSTPANMKAHSWHPVPVLLFSKYCRADNAEAFSEKECLNGSLGSAIPAEELMTLALAHAGRLNKYGA